MKLKTKLISVVLLAMTLVLVVVLFIVIGVYKAKIIAGYKQRALAIATSASAVLPPDEFMSIAASKDKESDVFKKNYELLNKILRANDIGYLYTMTKIDDSTFMYVLDGMDMNSDDYSNPGDTDTIDNYDHLVLDAFASNSVATDVYDGGVWGDLLSAFAPIKDAAGAVVGIIGVDIQAKDVRSGILAATSWLFVIFAASLVFMCFINLSLIDVVLSRRIDKLLIRFQDITSGTGDLT